MQNVNEVLKTLYSNNRDQMESLYLIGSVAEGVQNADSDIDLVCVLKNDVPLAFYKMLGFELTTLSASLGIQIEPFMFPFMDLKEPHEFSHYDFLIRMVLKDHGTLLGGNEIRHQIPELSDQSILDFRRWMGLMLFDRIFRHPENDHNRFRKNVLSFLSNVFVMNGKAPRDTWSSKTKLINSLKIKWPEAGVLIKEIDGLTQEQIKEKLKTLSSSVIKNLVTNEWKNKNVITLTKPALAGLFDWDLFLLENSELELWKKMLQGENLVIENVHQRLLDWMTKLPTFIH